MLNNTHEDYINKLCWRHRTAIVTRDFNDKYFKFPWFYELIFFIV